MDAFRTWLQLREGVSTEPPKDEVVEDIEDTKEVKSPKDPKKPINLDSQKKDFEKTTTVEYLDLACHILSEGWDEAHPSTRGFWAGETQPKHPFRKHPIMGLYGRELAGKGLDTVTDRAEKKKSPMNPMQIMSIMHQIQKLESKHEAKLIKIAEDTANIILNIPREIMDSDIDDMGGEGIASGQVTDGKEEFDELPDKVKKAIQKRITANALTHGGAMKCMYTAHHLAGEKLKALGEREEWAKELLNLYDMLVPSIHKQYWLFDANLLTQQVIDQSKVGSNSVDYSSGKPKIKAAGANFPTLIHELIKGGLELISHAGLEGLDEEETATVLKYADSGEDELWLLQVGVPLWEKFMAAAKKYLPQKEIAPLVRNLYKKEPDEMHEIIMAILDNSDKMGPLILSLEEDPTIDAKEIEDKADKLDDLGEIDWDSFPFDDD